MDAYKKQIRELRNELHNTKKEFKINKVNSDKYQKYSTIFNEVTYGGVIVSMIILAISYFSTNMFPVFFVSMICTGTISGIALHFNRKYMLSFSQYFNLYKKTNQITEEIKNTHYFNLEKQRNEVFKESGVDTLETIEKQIELLNEYKSRIKGIYDNNIPNEVDKEIEYLEKQAKIFKLNK